MSEVHDRPPSETNNRMAVRARGLSKEFYGKYAVEDISFDLAKGTIFGLIGPSGCGKTTTIRLLTGIYEPTSGEVTVLNKDPRHFSAGTRAKIGYMPQLFVLYPDLSIWENLNFAASLYGMSWFHRRNRMNEMLEFVELSDDRGKIVRKTSGGMQRRLSLAATLVHKPQLLFLDEPTAGIDPVLRRKFWDHFQNLKKTGSTLIVTTQYVGEAAYCDYVGVMSNGKLLMVDTPEGLRRQAYGGQVVEMVSKEPISFDTVAAIQKMDFVKQRVRFLSTNSIRITVDDASRAIPSIIEWCDDQNITIESVKEYMPPFDDVFVQLVQQGGKVG